MTREQFIGLVEEVQGPLRRFLCVLCGGDASRADDLAQEALLKAYLSFEGFEGRARFSTWLFRIAYNCFYDWRKAESRNPAVLSGDGLCCRSGSAAGPVVADISCSRSVRGSAVADVSRSGSAGGFGDGAGTEICSAEEADARFMYQQLYMAIDRLPVKEKAVVLLFYMEEKSIKEIVDITGMTSVTVRSHLFRARAHLRSFLDNLDK